MLGTFVDKATSVISSQFVMAYWIPTFIAFSLSLLFNSFFYPITIINDWWSYVECIAMNQTNCQTGVNLSLIFLSIILITVIAYLLQIFNRIIIQFFEGYWRGKPWVWLWDFFIEHQIRKWDDLVEKLHDGYKRADIQKKNQDARFLAMDYEDLHLLFPTKPKEFLPTKLGNILRSAEMYSEERYGMSCAFWWPRLWPLLSENLKSEIEDSLTPMISLLNLASLLPFVALCGIFIPLLRKQFLLQGTSFADLLFAGSFLIILLVIFWILYEVASTQAVSYGMTIRAAVDLYRFELFKSLHIEYPKNSIEERIIWTNLQDWLHEADISQAPSHYSTTS